MVIVLFSTCLYFAMESLVYANNKSAEGQSDFSVYIDVDAKTWKTRGRIFYDVEGSIRRKLASAGFKIVRNEQDSHDLTLSVRYREEKGEAFAVNNYGTVLRAKFSLLGESLESLWELEISESSENSVSGTPPYLDAVHKLDTNPYYFFIGGLLRKFLEQELNIDQALLVLIQQVALQQAPSTDESELQDRVEDFDHSRGSWYKFHLPMAVIRSIEELVRREDQRAIPVLSRLLHYPDESVRDRAIKALDVFEAL